jgi:2-dehydropantoate 2-reductase
MKIAIMGSGGVGGYYGALLARHGHDVTFIARGAHLKAIQDKGLQVKSIHGDFLVEPAQAIQDPAQTGPVDLVVFSTKTYATQQAAEQMVPLIGKETSILPLQNGIDTSERIGAVVGMEHMLGGVTWISSSIEAPGVIKQVSQFRRVMLGELDGNFTPRVQSINQTFADIGISSEVSENISTVLWTKFVFIATASSFGSLTRLPIGKYRAIPETRANMAALMQEIEMVARAQGVDLDLDIVQQSLGFIDGADPAIKPSMQLDVEAGKESELESMIGIIGRLGRKFDVPTPLADMVYATLLPGELEARARS